MIWCIAAAAVVAYGCIVKASKYGKEAQLLKDRIERQQAIDTALSIRTEHSRLSWDSNGVVRRDDTLNEDMCRASDISDFLWQAAHGHEYEKLRKLECAFDGAVKALRTGDSNHWYKAIRE